jgi:hypothetical protein
MLCNRGHELTHALVQSAAKERQDGPAAARDAHGAFKLLPCIAVDPYLGHTGRPKIELVNLHAHGKPTYFHVCAVPAPVSRHVAGW